MRIDPRLLRAAAAARILLASTAVATLVQTAAIIAFAWFGGHAIAGVVAGDSAGADAVASVALDAGLAAAAALVRGASVWLTGSLSRSAASRAKTQLREQALATMAEHGSPLGTAATSTALGRGLDALDGYFGQLVPQLVATVIATPAIAIALLAQDTFAGVAVIVCLPLIPLFMVLIGLATRRVQTQQWQATNALAKGFLETLEGLSTLKAFRRDRRAAARVRAVSDEQRVRTMAVLRVSFMSSLALELIASLSVALVAVSVGIRLIDGEMPLALAFSVLILVPDAFVPIRAVGAAFHASTEGLEASKAVLDIIDHRSTAIVGAAPGDGGAAGVDAAGSAGLVLRDVRVRRGEHELPEVSLTALPGTLTAIVGPSGVGKSSLIESVVGEAAASGERTLDGRAITRADVAWAPQGVWDALVPGTVAENVALGAAPSTAEIVDALRLAALTDVDPETPVEPATGGTLGLSGGQAQRVVLARAIRRAMAGAAILVVDEPTSALDESTELAVLAGLRAVADAGRIVVVASHREAVVGAADQVVRLEAAVRRIA